MTNFTYDTVLSTLEAGVRTITLNRPERLNAMTLQLNIDVAQAFEDANADPGTNAIIFTGAGRGFCAGDDRQDHIEPQNEAEARMMVDAIQRVTRAIVKGDRPVVGAINGWAVGGGFEWAINCDFPIWAESARAFFPEISLNFFVTGGVTSILPAIVGPVKAREMIMLGEKYTARDLADLGVAWRVVPDDLLMEEARAVAGRLAGLPPNAVRAMKRVLTLTATTDLNAALSLETEATITAFLDPLTTKLVRDF
ncbi:MAG: enoyl-CoA hydratase/isomerase family protein [Rhodobacterales bacterium]|jgi:enoyl-CoA hydratase/carnithine racemase|nr:enoyl-CoA hydratase/isomerase family protein [Pseudomonadota bacterium]MDA1285205.1 enoyl-CoA hydratase/isomerase family protein [Pseudomonadota bacterium]NQW12870.1 enoyl-CoA hydratase/isomerase family protein [Rhodobacter sp.]